MNDPMPSLGCTIGAQPRTGRVKKEREKKNCRLISVSAALMRVAAPHVLHLGLVALLPVEMCHDAAGVDVARGHEE